MEIDGEASIENEYDLAYAKKQAVNEAGDVAAETDDRMILSTMNAAGMEYSPPLNLEMPLHNCGTDGVDQCHTTADGMEDSMATNEGLQDLEQDVDMNASNPIISGDLQDTDMTRKEPDDLRREEYMEEIRVKASHRRGKSVDAHNVFDKMLATVRRVTRRQVKPRPPSSSQNS